VKSTEYQGLIVGVSEKFGMGNTKPEQIWRADEVCNVRK
jgi:hypothetical protein